MLCYPLTQRRNNDCVVATGQSSQLQGDWRLHQTARHDAACRPFNLVDSLGLARPIH